MTNDAPSPLPKLPPREAESHKGNYGRLLIVGGSRGMSGAVALAGKAALRGGAGLVTLAVADKCLDTIAAIEPCYMTTPLPCDKAGKLTLAAQGEIARLLQTATVAACGPGLGQSDEITSLVAWLYQSAVIPLVVDADGLNALAARPAALRQQPAGARVLTPHPGEFRRLIAALGIPGQGAVDQQVRELAGQCCAVVVLKSHRTVIVDESRWQRNTTGNPGMATGGSGDVLTGIITALIGQGLPAFDAAWLGVHVHGLAGDLAAAEKGQVALIASDLIAYLPQAFRQLESAS